VDALGGLAVGGVVALAVARYSPEHS
jgi:hypothetical protein